MAPELYRQKHIDYIKSLDEQTEEYEYWLSEHLRLNGVYWGLTALCILNSKDTFQKESVVEFVQSCWCATGGFAPFPNHDPHLLTTLSGLQILLTMDSLDWITDDDTRLKLCVEFICSNQLDDGSFQGDKFGEIDLRFSYNALSCLSILGKLTPEIVNPAVEYIIKCLNFDGGFGLCPGAESHGSNAFIALGALKITNKMDLLTKEQIDNISWWLCERQVPEGGLNGRPSKLPDVCYSFWILSALAILDRIDWIGEDKLSEFILESQDPVKGGISDRPGNEVDVFHTVFGLAGLSLMQYPNLIKIDPVYCMTYDDTKKIKRYPYQ